MSPSARTEISGRSCEVQRDFGAALQPRVDLLLVTDESAAGGDDGAARAAFLRDLGTVVGTLPYRVSLHVAAVSAVPGGGGQLDPGACIADGDAFAVSAPDPDWACGDGDRCGFYNYPGSLADLTECLGQAPLAVGEGSQPLAMALRVLDGSVPGNVGFLREDVMLGVVIVTGRDDESPGAISDLGAALDELSAGHVTVSVVTRGDTPRLDSLRDQLPSVYLGDLDGDPLDTISWLGGGIIDGWASVLDAEPIDADPRRPGIEPACAATLNADAHGPEELLPLCSMRTPNQPHPDTELPCWWVEPAYDGELYLHLESTPAAPSRYATVRCEC